MTDLTVLVIDTPTLGDRSYLVHDGEVAFVVDPQRDIDRVLALLDEHGVRLTHVFETHIHNDYVTGGLALAGNYNGLRIFDIGRPKHPTLLKDLWCPGPQNDVSIWGDLIVMSVDTVLTGPARAAGAAGVVPRLRPQQPEPARPDRARAPSACRGV